MERIEWVDADELLSPWRLDLIVKIQYVEDYILGRDMTFIKTLYKHHIDVFSNGTYIEPNTPEKNSIEKYMEAFDILIDKIREEGFDESKSVVPVDSENILCDGAHRTAIAYVLRLKIPIIRKQNVKGIRYDVFLMERQLMQKQSINYIVAGYLQRKKNTYILLYGGKISKAQKVQIELYLNDLKYIKIMFSKFKKEKIWYSVYVIEKVEAIYNKDLQNLCALDCEVLPYGNSRLWIEQLLGVYHENVIVIVARDIFRRMDRRFFPIKKSLNKAFPILYKVIRDVRRKSISKKL